MLEGGEHQSPAAPDAFQPGVNGVLDVIEVVRAEVRQPRRASCIIGGLEQSTILRDTLFGEGPVLGTVYAALAACPDAQRPLHPAELAGL